MKHFLTIFALLLFTGISFGSADWPNEPQTGTVISDFGWDTREGNGWKCQYPGGKLINDPTAPLSAPSVMQDSWVNHTSVDVCNATYSFPAGTNEFYAGLKWKPSNPYYGWQNNEMQKILLADVARNHNYLFMARASGTSGASSAYRTAVSLNGAGVDNCHVAAGVSCDMFYSNISGNMISLGQWNTLEWYLKASTNRTSRDGVVRWWLNGTLAGNYTNVNFSYPDFWEVKAYHWDNTPDPQQVTDFQQFDHVRLKRTNCGSECTANMPLLVTNPIPTSAQVGKAYSATLGALGGKAPYGWTISAGSLPQGLTLNKTTGVISGTPTTVGRSDFTVKVMDSNVPTGEATKAFTIIVSSNPNATISKAGLSVVGSQLSVKANAGGVRFGMNQPAPFSLNVYDLSGREMWRHSGSGEAVWNHGGKLRKGVYLVRAEQNGRTMKTNYCHVW